MATAFQPDAYQNDAFQITADIGVIFSEYQTQGILSLTPYRASVDLSPIRDLLQKTKDRITRRYYGIK